MALAGTPQDFFLIAFHNNWRNIIEIIRQGVWSCGSRNSLWILFFLALAACSPASPSLSQPRPAVLTLAATVTQPPVVPNTPTVEPTPTPTLTQTLAPTDTFLPTATTTTDPQSATLQAQVGSMGFLMNISQYFHPVGTPLQSWHDVPVMPQATAGQEFNVHVYSYVDAATLSEAQQYYAGKLAALGITNPPAYGSAGTGSQGYHGVDFFSYELTIVLTSYDDDTRHVIVVISSVL